MREMIMNETQAQCSQPQEECTMCEPCGEQAKAVSLSVLREHRLRERNLQDLAALQAIMATEEDEALSTQQVLRRVLGFYNKYVPFMQ